MEAAKHLVQIKLEARTREFLSRARTAADALTAAADGLEVDPNYTLNSLGVLQGQGPEIDRLCGVISVLRDILEVM